MIYHRRKPLLLQAGDQWAIPGGRDLLPDQPEQWNWQRKEPPPHVGGQGIRRQLKGWRRETFWGAGIIGLAWH